MVGISNPYLSQIERGLRAPSEHVLRAIAASLQTSADALVRQVEGARPDERTPSPVIAAIEEDPDLTARQRRTLAEIYTAFTEQTATRRHRRGWRQAGPDQTKRPEDN